MFVFEPTSVHLALGASTAIASSQRPFYCRFAPLPVRRVQYFCEFCVWSEILRWGDLMPCAFLFLFAYRAEAAVSRAGAPKLPIARRPPCLAPGLQNCPLRGGRHASCRGFKIAHRAEAAMPRAGACQFAYRAEAAMPLSRRGDSMPRALVFLFAYCAEAAAPRVGACRIAHRAKAAVPHAGACHIAYRAEAAAPRAGACRIAHRAEAAVPCAGAAKMPITRRLPCLARRPPCLTLGLQNRLSRRGCRASRWGIPMSIA